MADRQYPSKRIVKNINIVGTGIPYSLEVICEIYKFYFVYIIIPVPIDVDKL